MEKAEALIFTVWMLALLLSPAVHAAPYWVKPGVHVTYIAKRDDSYIQQQIDKGSSPEAIRTAGIVYFRNDTYYTINAYNTSTLGFEIASIKNGYATVDVVLDLKNVTVNFEVPKGSKASAFWDNDSVLNFTCRKPLSGTKLVCIYHLKELSFQGRYKIRLDDGGVFSVNGTYYGHTFLWIDPGATPKENETFVVLPALNWTMEVKRVSSRDEAQKTYYGEFGPPVATLSLIGPPLVIKGVVEFTTSIWGSIRYDPATGIVLSPTTLSVLISPDLSAVGIPFAAFTDERVAYDYEVNRNYVWAGLLPLYDTNAEFQRAEKVPFPKPKTRLEFAFYGSLVILGLVVVVGLKRR
ncbi:hypothetical protein [Thermococcus sp.]|uniref:hypothetical protein n=1 Tax=Thermococcus sp. TaxID=35749 RepID=UPI0025F8DA53|nr:hypothetical protein [Thermococcus sp.]